MIFINCLPKRSWKSLLCQKLARTDPYISGRFRPLLLLRKNSNTDITALVHVILTMDVYLSSYKCI